MRELARLYLRLVAASLRARLHYRWDFLATLCLYAIVSTVDFLMVGAILYRFRTMAGWNLWEVGLLYGLMSISMGLFRTLASELHDVDGYLLRGEFDTLLLRPWPSLLVLLTRQIDLGRLGAVLQGTVVLLLAIRRLTEAQVLSPWAVPYLLALPLAGTLILVGIALVTGAVYFWAEGAGQLKIFTQYAPNAAGSFPLHIYPGWLRWLFFSLIPIAYLNFVPLRYLLGKGGGPLSLAAPALASVAMVGVGLILWRWGQRHYQSTGT